jgi:hypothetical protein
MAGTHISLKPIVAAIVKAQKQGRRLRSSLEVPQRKKLNVKLRKLEKIRRAVRKSCKAFNMF